MAKDQHIGSYTVIGPLGELMTLNPLPLPDNTTRWSARSKRAVVAAVNDGLLNIEEACERYDLTLEEFASWQCEVERSGRRLRVTELYQYRALYACEP